MPGLLVRSQSLTKWVPGALSQGVKQTGGGAEHLALSSAEVKNARTSS
jgi:hypothetical protein